MKSMYEKERQANQGLIGKRIAQLALIIVLILLLIGSCSLYKKMNEDLQQKGEEGQGTEQNVDGIDDKINTDSDEQKRVQETVNNKINQYDEQNGVGKADKLEESGEPDKVKEPDSLEEPEEPVIIEGKVLLLSLSKENSGVYADLQSAISAAKNIPSYIYILEDLTEEVITDRNQNIILNLNGKVVTSAGITFINRAKLDLIDYNIPNLDMVIEILNGTNEEEKEKILNSYTEYVSASELLPTEIGTIQTTPAPEELGIAIYNTGRLTIHNGNIKAVMSDNIEAGYGIYNYGELADLSLIGGNIETTGAKENVALYNYFTVDGLDIKDTKITVNSKRTAIGFANYNSVASIKNCNITAIGIEKSYGITNSDGELTLTGGKIEAKGEEARGLYSINDSRLTIGKKIIRVANVEEMPSKENPDIYGDTYGVDIASGRFYFYDGLLKGIKKGLTGAVTGTEKKCQIERKVENGVENVFLSKASVVRTEESVATIEVDGQLYYYSTLDSALASVDVVDDENTEPTTINMIADTEEECFIAEDKSVVLKLNGFKIVSSGLTLTNSGKLVIESENSVGTIKTTGEYNGVIKNIGEVTVENVRLIAEVENDGYGIYNAGTKAVVNINSGTTISINGNTAIGISNEKGTVNLNAGTVTSSGNSGKGISNNLGVINFKTGNVYADGQNGMGIYNASGIVNMGTQDGIANSSTLYVTAGYIGVFNYDEAATLNFYDGTIKGKSAWKNDRGILNVERAYVEVVERQYQYENATLKYYIAEIGEKHFATLKAAVAAVPNNGEKTTIRMVKDVALQFSENISSNQNIVLDLNGKTIEGTTTLISNSGTLEIKDTGLDGTLLINNIDSTVINNYGETVIDGVTIRTTGTVNATGIYNGNELTIKDSEILITRAQTGYGISNSGIVRMESGLIDVSNSTEGYGISGLGDVVLGLDEQALNIENPSIFATTYGVNCKNLDFYNGVIKAEQKAINAYVRLVKTAHEINESTDVYNVAILQLRDTQLTNNTVAIIEEENETQYFRSINNAITYVQKNMEHGTTIKVVKDTEENLEVPAEKNITIDLNDNTISSDETTIINNGTLEIVDSVGNGNIQSAAEKCTIVNNGVLTYRGGNVNNGVLNNDTASVYGGKISASTIGIENKKELNVYGGEISGETFGVKNAQNAILNFSAGKISGKSDWRNYDGTLNIPENYEIFVVSENEFENATVVESDLNETEQSVAKISKNSVTKYYKSLEGAINSINSEQSTTVVMLRDTNETVNIMGTQYIIIDLAGKVISSNAVTISNYNNLTVLDSVGTGKIETTANVENKSIAISNNGKLNVEAGSVLATSADYGYAISSYSGNSDISIGKIGGEPSTSIPRIIGTQYGIYQNGGIVRFFDGKISGKIDSNNGTIYELQSGYDLEKTNDGEYKAITLQLPSKIYTANSVATIVRNAENYYYNSLAGAISSVSEAEGNVEIKLLKNIEEGNSIGETKNITLDLAGFTISSDGSVISNYGVLTLKDSVGTGEIVSEYIGINNAGTFNFDSGVIKGKQSAIQGKINSIKDLYEVSIQQDEEYKKAILILADTNQTEESVAVFSKQGVNYYYRSLYSAINAVALDEENTTVVSLLKDVEESVEIYEGQNITLQLNGNTLSSNETTIINNGILLLTNSEDIGMVTSNEMVVENNKKLQIEEVIISLNDGCSGRAIENNNELIINSGEVKTNAENSIGIYNNNGTVTVLSGTVQAKGTGSIGISNYGEEGFVTIGDEATIIGKLKYNVTANVEDVSNDAQYVGSVAGLELYGLNLLNSEIKVLGDCYGVNNSNEAVLKFYDGVIYGGEEWKNQEGQIIVKDGCEVKVKTVEEYRIASIDDMETELTSNTVAILTQDNETYYYKSLTGALLNIKPDVMATIKLAKNTNEYVDIDTKEKVVLDLNGKIITSANNTITNRGTLIIEDNSEEHNGKVISTGNVNEKSSAIKNEGILNIESGIIEAAGDDIGYGIYNATSEAKTTIGSNDLKVSVTSPIIRGTTFGLYKSTGIVNFYDGIIAGKTSGSNVEQVGFDRVPSLYEITEIKNGEFFELTLNKYVASIGDARYESLEEAINAVQENNMNTVITMLNNAEEIVEIKENQNITLNLNGRTISSNGVTITNNGKLEVVGSGTIATTGETEETGIAIKNNSDLTITSGTVMATSENYGVGIYNNSDLTLGTQSGVLIKTTPTIKANTYGIYNNDAIINYYDGQIMSKMTVINGDFTTIEDKCELKTEIIDGYKVVKLMKYVAMLDNEKYESIQQAIESIKNYNAENTVIVLENTYENVSIPYNKNIVLNLNGKTITGTSATITNKGILKIIDTVGGGKLDTVNLSEPAVINNSTLTVLQGEITGITNNAILTIGQNDEIIDMENPKIIGNRYGIYSNANNAVLSIYDGIIKGKTIAVDGKIKNVPVDYEINEQQVSEYYTVSLIKMESELTENTVASITKNEQTKYYRTIKNALRAVKDSSTTIKVEKSVTEKVQIFSGLAVTIDLNGKTVSTSGNVIENKGVLTLTDNGENGTIKSTNGGVAVENFGTITLNNVIIESSEQNGIGFINNYKAIFNFNSGKIIGKSSSIIGAGSIYVPTNYMVYKTTQDNCEVAQLVLYVARAGGRTYAHLQDAINDLLYDNTITMVLNVNEAVTIPTGKTIALSLNGKTITSETTTITNNGKLSIIGNGEIESTGENKVAILNNNELIANTGKIISKNGDAILNNHIVKIKDAKVSSDSANGINNKAIVELGNSAEDESSQITGETYGIYNENTSILNFNGGIIKGKTDWSNAQGKINVPRDYEVNVQENDNYKLAKLVLKFIDKPAESVAAIRIDGGNNYYTSLADALETIGTNDEAATTITMLKDTQEEVTILPGQKVVIDLNGKQIISEGTTITNNGDLTIKDTLEQGCVKGKVAAFAGENEVKANEGYEFVKYTLNDYEIVKIIKSIVPEDPGEDPVEEPEKTTIVAVIPTLDDIKIFTSLQDAVNSVSTGSSTETRIILLINTQEKIVVNNGQNVAIDLSGKTITSTETAIENNGKLRILDSKQNGKITTSANQTNWVPAIVNNSILTVQEGNVEYGISNNADLTLGQQGKIPNKTIPTIIGNNYGICNENEYCTIKFYDGKIKGKLGWYNEVGNLEIQTNCDLTVNVEGEYETACLDTGIAKIGNIYYTSIQNAINAIDELPEGTEPTSENATTITIRESTEEKIIIPQGKNIKIDLNGKIITSEGVTVTNNGTLTLCDNKTTGKVISTEDTQDDEDLGKAIINNGRLNVENTVVEALYGIAILSNTETAEVTLGVEGNVSITIPKISGIYGIYEENENSVLTIYDGKITGVIKSIYGTIETTEFGYYASTTNEVTTLKSLSTTQKSTSVASVTYGETTYYADKLQIAINTSPINKQDATQITILKNITENVIVPENKNIKLDLNGKTITSETTIITNKGSLQILDSSEAKTGKIQNTGDIASTAKCIENKANLTIESGEYITTGVAYGYTVLNDAENATVTVNGGNVISEGTNGRAIVNNLGQITVAGGKISAQGSNAYGIYTLGEEQAEKCTVIIGTEGGEINKDLPEITSGTYGIYNEYENVTVKFFDGIIKGKIEWKNNVGSLTLEKECELEKQMVNEYETATLNKFVAYIGVERYESLQDAINAVSTTGVQTKITMLRNVEEQVTTYEGQNILLDLSGYIINSQGITITNNATLEIQNSKETGAIQTTANTEETAIAIQNNSTITLTSGTVQALGTNYGYGIANSETATVTFNGGKIKGTTNWSNGIGTITPKSNYKIEVTQEGNYKVAELVEWYVAKIGTQRYKTLKDAVAAVPIDRTQTTIVMYEDVTENCTIKYTNNVILDLNGKSINYAGTAITNNGALKIIDSTEEQLGTINGTGSNGIAIYNRYTTTITNVQFTLESGTLTGNQGINNYSALSSAVLNCEVTGGVVLGQTYGIYNCTGSSTATVELIIGTSGNGIDSTSPLIKGETNTINNATPSYNTGKINVNYYDGKLQSKNDAVMSNQGSYQATISIEDNCQIVEYIENGYTTNILVPNESMEGKVAFMPSGDGIKSYQTVQAAIDDVPKLQEQATQENITTITLLQDVQEQVIIPENKNINLFLNSKTLTSAGTTITNNGTLKIIDTEKIGKVITTSNIEGATAIQNSGILKVECGIILAKGENYGKAITNIGENSSVTIGTDNNYNCYNPTIKGTEYGVYAENGTYNFYSGRIYGKTNATNIEENISKAEYEVRKFMEVGYEGKILLPEGDTSYICAKSKEESFTLYTSLDVTTAGTYVLLQDITTEPNIKIVYNMVILELNGKVLKNNITNQGNLTVVDSSAEQSGKIYSSGTTIYNYTETKYNIVFTLNSGTIQGNERAIYNYVYNSSSYYSARTIDCTINGGTLIGGIGIENYNKNESSNKVFNYIRCYINGGIIEGTESYGIYNHERSVYDSKNNPRQSGIIYVYLGNNDGSIEENSPIITGKTNGIYQTINTGIAVTTYFYDGQIRSITGNPVVNIEGTLRTNVNCIPASGYAINVDTEVENDVTYNVATLAPIIAKIGSVNYLSVQDAINAASTTATTIELLRNTSESISISSEKNITINLNGYNINSLGTAITNEGTLTITGEKGTIEGNIGIQNSGTLTLNGSINIIAESTGVINGEESVLNFYDAIIKGKSAWCNKLGTINTKDMKQIQEQTIGEYKCATIAKTAQIGEQKYDSLALAIAAVPKDGTETTIKMLTDTVETVTIANTDNVVLDLNGKTITSTGNTIQNNGILKIEDNSISKEGSIIGRIAIYNFSDLIIEEGKIQATDTAICNQRGAKEVLNCTVNGGNIKGESKALYNYTMNFPCVINCTINDGTIESNSIGIENETYAYNTTHSQTINCTIIKGKIFAKYSAIYNYVGEKQSNNIKVITTIGTQGTPVDSGTLQIVGDDYGVNQYQTSGKVQLNYYDGIIKSKGKPIYNNTKFPGTVVTPNDYKIVNTTEVINNVTYNVVTLEER